MAKINVRIADLERYSTNKNMFINVVMLALEDHSPKTFLVTRSQRHKNNFISMVEELWEQAVVLAKEDVFATDLKIKIVLEDINQVKTCLAIGGCTLYGKLAYNWKLLRLHFKKIPLVDFLALHIAEHGNNLAEKEELFQQLDLNILTAEDFANRFDSGKIRYIAPDTCPACDNYLSVDQVPYLEELCKKMRNKHCSTDELREAWDKMLEKKSHQIDCSKWYGFLTPADALYLLFEKLDYADVKKHYAAFLKLINAK